MYKIPLNEIKEKIIASGKINGEELDQKVKEKINELSGLISEEGAAHIIANELGVELVSQTKNKLKIKEIYAGMKNITAVGKVVRKFDVHQFQKGESMGKVCSLILGDDSGTIRVVFWNDQVDSLNDVKDEDVIEIKNAYVRENKGNKEVHINDNSEITVNPEGVTIESVRQTTSFERKKIAELEDGGAGVEVLGTVVQVFDPRFFNVCPQCAKRATEVGGAYNCNTHGSVQPSLSYVMNLVLDDGTGTTRAVFWKNQTNHLVNKKEEEFASYKENLALFEDVKNSLLGEQIKLMGRVKKNEMFDRLEFNVQMVEKADPKIELEKLEKGNS